MLIIIISLILGLTKINTLLYFVNSIMFGMSAYNFMKAKKDKLRDILSLLFAGLSFYQAYYFVYFSLNFTLQPGKTHWVWFTIPLVPMHAAMFLLANYFKNHK